MDKLFANLHWLIPFIVLLISLGYQVYSLTDKVARIEIKQNETGAAYIKKVDRIEYRLERIEEFCCSEIKKH